MPLQESDTFRSDTWLIYPHAIWSQEGSLPPVPPFGTQLRENMKDGLGNILLDAGRSLMEDVPI